MQKRLFEKKVNIFSSRGKDFKVFYSISTVILQYSTVILLQSIPQYSTVILHWFYSIFYIDSTVLLQWFYYKVFYWLGIATDKLRNGAAIEYSFFVLKTYS